MIEYETSRDVVVGAILADVLNQSKMYSITKMARVLGIDRSLLKCYLGGLETIPNEHLARFLEVLRIPRATFQEWMDLTEEYMLASPVFQVTIVEDTAGHMLMPHPLARVIVRNFIQEKTKTFISNSLLG